jgi:hypothetical protein
MIRHVVLLRWKADAPAEGISKFTNGIAGLGAGIDVVRQFTFGPNVGKSKEGMAGEPAFSDNYDFVVTADVDDYSAYEVYAEHPTHLVWIEETVRPILAERVAIQYEIEG